MGNLPTSWRQMADQRATLHEKASEVRAYARHRQNQSEEYLLDTLSKEMGVDLRKVRDEMEKRADADRDANERHERRDPGPVGCKIAVSSLIGGELVALARRVGGRAHGALTREACKRSGAAPSRGRRFPCWRKAKRLVSPSDVETKRQIVACAPS